MTDKKFDVVVVGSSNMDLIAYVDKLPVLGETILGSKFAYVACDRTLSP
jgi:sugar/nucleoside kinase (ribokinase family)